MQTQNGNTNDDAQLIQQSASIGVPGSWIADDESVDATMTKIGGSAKYWTLWQKSNQQFECLSCKRNMHLLAQINSPLYSEQCQRNIYVFMCKKPKCTKTSKGWKVTVHRGPVINDYTHHQNTNNNHTHQHQINDSNETRAEMNKLIKQNNRTKKSNHKNKNESDSFWNNELNKNSNSNDDDDKNNDNKLQCKMNELNDDFAKLLATQQQLLNELDNETNDEKKLKPKNKKYKKVNNKKPKMKKGTFIPFELVIYDEGYYKKNKNEIMNSDILKWNDKEIDLKKLFKQKKDDDHKMNDDAVDEEDEDGDNEHGEDLLVEYLSRVSVDRRQCIRYCYGDYPLLPMSINLDKIPECVHCGNKKVFEFQIMSNLLNYLEPKQIHHDWLTVLVFVCPLTCQQSNDEYVIVCCEE